MLESLVSLHSQCFPDKNWTADDFMDLKKSGCEIIASDNGFIVWRLVGIEAEIITLGTAPEFRKTGIGEALIGIAMAEIKKSGGQKIFLEVSIQNAPAINLYKKLGFESVGTRPKYYNGVDAIIMEKTL